MEIRWVLPDARTGRAGIMRQTTNVCRFSGRQSTTFARDIFRGGRGGLCDGSSQTPGRVAQVKDGTVLAHDEFFRGVGR